MASSTSAPGAPLLPPGRVVSLDALRGFDMFWILGGDVLVHTIGERSHSPIVSWIAGQMDHSDWEGFRFYDLIFPMFVFIVGVSLVFSLSKTISTSGTGGAVKRILSRSAILFVLGILYYGGAANAWPKIRLLGVLQRIAICYLVAGLLFTYFRPSTLASITAALLLIYFGLVAWAPVPGVGRGNFAERMNLADYIDKVALPGRLWAKDHDPEGLLSTLPAIASCLLGVFAGLLLRNERVAPWKKVALLLVAGGVGVGLGMAWGGMFPPVPALASLNRLQFPVIKKIWTSSFVLVAAGYSAALLGLFYLIIDVMKLQLWARPFVWIGMNAITLYLLEAVLSFPNLARRFVGGNVGEWLGPYAQVAHAGIALLLVLLLARFLYRRSIFLRL